MFVTDLARNIEKRSSRWDAAAVPLCTIFAFVLALLQYSVSEARYGIDSLLTCVPGRRPLRDARRGR